MTGAKYHHASWFIRQRREPHHFQLLIGHVADLEILPTLPWGHGCFVYLSIVPGIHSNVVASTNGTYFSSSSSFSVILHRQHRPRWKLVKACVQPQNHTAPNRCSALLAWTHVVTNARFGGQDISSKYSSATTVCICALNIYHIKHAYIPGPHYSTSGRNKYIVMPTTTWSIAGRSTACPMVASASKNEAGCRRHVCARRGTEQAERKNATIDTK